MNDQRPADFLTKARDTRKQVEHTQEHVLNTKSLWLTTRRASRPVLLVKRSLARPQSAKGTSQVSPQKPDLQNIRLPSKPKIIISKI